MCKKLVEKTLKVRVLGKSKAEEALKKIRIMDELAYKNYNIHTLYGNGFRTAFVFGILSIVAYVN
jgi:hypothetical protein